MITRLVVLLPLLTALLGLCTRRPRVAAVIAGAGALATLGLALTASGVDTGGVTSVPTVTPLDFGRLEVPLRLVTSSTLAAVAVVVALVTLVVQVYSAWYLGRDDRAANFHAVVSLFSAAMLLVVHSGDLVLTLVGWEVMGWCSYLLIGHWSRDEVPRRAAQKAYLVTRVADIAFVLGFVGLAAGAGSTATRTVVDLWGAAPDGGWRDLLLVLVVIGVLGKSAQIPFQDWLPDAMAGPTPASALIHAATMVAAGTVVLGGLFDLFVRSDAARWLLAVSTAVTMVVAALMALAQSDLKRLLAWSTVSQVAVMLSAIAAAPAEAGAGPGLFHLWSHAWFKALLFLTLGWLGVLGGGTAAASLRGVVRGWPLFHLFFLAGLASLGGVPFTVGGLSKEHVVATAYEGALVAGPGLVAVLALLVTAALTGAYATRAYLVVTAGEGRQLVTAGVRRAIGAVREGGARGGIQTLSHGGPAPEGAPNPLVVGALSVLALGTVLGGLIVLTDAFALPTISGLWLGVTLLAASLGAAIVVILGRQRDLTDRMPRRLVAAADAGLGADRAYRVLVARPVLALARAVARFDEEVVDGLVRGAVAGMRGLGRASARVHRLESPSFSAALVVLGLMLLALAGVISWP